MIPGLVVNAFSMTTRSLERLYEKYYGGDKARRGLFDSLAAWRLLERVLYPGGFIHVTASFVFPSVVYVDNDHNAKRFFSQLDNVLSFVDKNKVYTKTPELRFHDANYESGFDEPEGSFDLLISLYAGFVSEPCKRYLKVGGILVANNSHGDAGLASINPDYQFIAVLQGKGGRLRVVEEGLDAYFKPKKEIKVTKELLRKRGRGFGYTKSAPAYLFKRVC